MRQSQMSNKTATVFMMMMMMMNYREKKAFITSLAKGGYVFGSIGLSICLFVDITQNVMNGLAWNFIRGGAIKNYF